MITKLEKIRSGLLLVFQNVTIEPMMFLYYCAVDLSLVINENLRLDRFCRIELNHSQEDCSNLLDGNHDDIQIETQKLENQFLVYEAYTRFVFEFIILILIANWSDKNGRLIPMLISLFGYIMYTAVYLLTSLSTSWSAWVLLVGTFFKSVCASTSLILMAAFSYISDITDESSRTSRMLYLQVVKMFGQSAGLALAPILYDAQGYALVYSTSIIMLVVSFIYAIIVMKDRKTKIKKSNENNDVIECLDSNNSNNKCRKLIKLLTETKENIKELIKTSIKKREGHKRFIINFIVLIFLTELGSTIKKKYLWVRRVLHWDQDVYSFYKVLGKWGTNISMVILAPILKHFNIHDCSSIAVIQIFMFCEALSFALTTGPSLWFIPFIYVMVPSFMQFVTLRALLSKQCNINEVGRLYSLVAIAESIWPVFEDSLYGAVYNATVEGYPSAIHLMSAAFSVLTLACILMTRLLLFKDEFDGVGQNLDNYNLNTNGELSTSLDDRSSNTRERDGTDSSEKND